MSSSRRPVQSTATPASRARASGWLVGSDLGSHVQDDRVSERRSTFARPAELRGQADRDVGADLLEARYRLLEVGREPDVVQDTADVQKFIVDVHSVVTGQQCSEHLRADGMCVEHPR
jgi:hypothetical protein